VFRIKGVCAEPNKQFQLYFATMEHNIIDLTTLPQEVHEAIFSIVNAADLCSMSLVSKEILQILTNQRIWKVSKNI
jgi:hypothetical protein